MKKFLIGLAAAALFSTQAVASHAVLFGLANPKVPGEPYFWDNASGTFGVTGGSLDVEFTFLVANSCGPIGVPIDATLTISAASAGAVTIGPPSQQPLMTYSFTITEDGSGDNLLSGTAPLAFLDQAAPDSAALSTTSAVGLTFTSDCLVFTGSESATFSFSSTTPDAFAAGGNGLLIDMLFGGNGNFSADIQQIPEPGTVGLLFSSCIGGGVLLARRRRVAIRK